MEFCTRNKGEDNISEHFKYKEFACKCFCDNYIISYDLIDAIEWVRNEIKSPIIVNSGYRCPVRNRLIMGADRSYHTMGMAVDFTTNAVRTNKDLLDKYKEIILKYNSKMNIIIYHDKGFIHFDVRHL